MAQAATELVAAGDDRALERIIASLAIPDDDIGRVPVVVAIAAHRVFPKREKQVRAALIHVLLADPSQDARHVATNALLKDDDPAVARALRAALEKETYDVIRGVIEAHLEREAARERKHKQR